MEDIRIKLITFDMNCSYLKLKLDRKVHAVQHVPNVKNFCAKIILYVYHYKMKYDFYIIRTIYSILTKERPMILPKFDKQNS